jgi:hypothetical protein
MRLFILCLFSLTLFAGDSPPAKPLPAGVDPIVNEYKDAVTKARAAYEAVCAKALDKALDKLDSKNKEIIKRGDVDGAIAVKAVMEKVKSGKVREEAEKTVETDFLGNEKPNTDLIKELVGKWSITYTNGLASDIEINKEKDDLVVVRTSGYGGGSHYKLIHDVKRFCYSGTGFEGAKIEYYSVANGKLLVKHCHNEAQYDNPDQIGNGVKQK